MHLLQNSEVDHNRFPPCLFPLSIPTSSGDYSTARGHVELRLNGRWNAIESSFNEQGITLPAITKAAWALTLHYFVSSELICFEYHNHFSTNKDGNNDAVLSDPSK